MPVTGMSSIWFPVADWHRAKHFYGEALGLRSTFCSDEAGWAAYSAGEHAPPIFLVRKTESTVGKKGGTLGFFATDVPALLKQIEAAGGAEVDCSEEENGVRIHIISDPDGNILELTEKTEAA